MRVVRFAASIAVLAGAFAAPSPARAQTPAPAPSPMSVKWNNGLSLESADGETKIQLGGLFQVDGRFAANDPAPIVDTFLVRRGRFLFQGRVQKYFEFNFVPDFSGSVLTLFDAYVDTVFSPGFRVRAGKAKAPIGLESLYSDAALPFAERSLGNNLVPNRDVGVRATGDLAGGRFNYTIGVEDGAPDDSSAETDANGGKDLVGRVTVHLGPAGLALGGSHGHETGALAGFKSTAQQTFFSYAAGVAAGGLRTRLSPSVFAYVRRFGGYGEYFRTAEDLSKSATITTTVDTGWSATGVVVLTGENATDHGVTPKAPFDPAHGHWGALQIAVRGSGLTVDPAAFAAALAASGSSRRARSFGVSLVWYQTAYVKQTLSVERTVFDGDPRGPRRAENAIVFRVQLNLAPKLS